MAPKGTPAPIIDKLHREVLSVMATPEVKTYMANASIELVGSSPAEFGIFFREEIDRWAKSSREPVPKSISAAAPHHQKAMSEQPLAAPVTGVEHWTKKGDVRLFLWEKFVDAPDNKPAVLFVHGSSMASQPTFDLNVVGRADSSVMDWFARRGFVCWSVDMEGYGRSDKHRDITCDIANGADDLAAATDYIAVAAACRVFSTAFLRCAARRIVRANASDRVARLALDAFVWTGEGSPTLEQRRKKLPEFQGEAPAHRQSIRLLHL